MRRREFFSLLGGVAAAGPLAARAQQPAMPVIGVLSTRASGADLHLLIAFREGLKEVGYVEGRNVTVEYRFAENQYDRLPALATDLVRRRVAVIATTGTPAAPAAKAATATIPIVFNVAVDPVELGLVASLRQPGGNLTGVTVLAVALASKRLEILHELMPAATAAALLVNPTNPTLAEASIKEVQMAAHMLGMQLHVLNASTEDALNSAFAPLAQPRVGGLVIGADPFFNSSAEKLAALALRHAVPTVYQYRTFAAAGGLMSYGGSLTDSYRLVGIYTGRILRGEKPADLPVEQATKVELIVNLKTARSLGLAVPTALLVRADEVIE